MPPAAWIADCVLELYIRDKSEASAARTTRGST
jgi:hypothetical protein